MITPEQEAKWRELSEDYSPDALIVLNVEILTDVLDTLAQLRDQLASATQTANRAGEVAAKYRVTLRTVAENLNQANDTDMSMINLIDDALGKE